MIKKIFVLMAMLALTACGSVSNMNNLQNKSAKLKLNNYNMVIINDFTDGTCSSKDNPVVVADGKKFADMIAGAMKKDNTFDKVERNIRSNDDALVIDGKIVKHNEGNPALRALIGFGAGSSRFDAQVLFKDNKTKALLGNVGVNKMSWALGGLVASSQDVKSHMECAAGRIAEEVKKAK